MVKAMRADVLDWGTDCRQAVHRAPAGIIRGRMAEDADHGLGSPDGRDRRAHRRFADRRRDRFPKAFRCLHDDLDTSPPASDTSRPTNESRC